MAARLSEKELAGFASGHVAPHESMAEECIESRKTIASLESKVLGLQQIVHRDTQRLRDYTAEINRLTEENRSISAGIKQLQEANAMLTADKSKLPASTLTVIIIDHSPLVHMGEPVAKRSVRIKLTDEQQQALRLKYIGRSGTNDLFEEVSCCFLEDDNG